MDLPLHGVPSAEERLDPRPELPRQGLRKSQRLPRQHAGQNVCLCFGCVCIQFSLFQYKHSFPPNSLFLSLISPSLPFYTVVSICRGYKVHKGKAPIEHGLCPFSWLPCPQTSPVPQDQGVLSPHETSQTDSSCNL
ncbi:hypothetical protein GBAR_LOCUS4361 [Geodia barretti]|uniref:Uncharacterized protein n=1 Tax=Geodia barretti TaxID=519541 RepID=A0AA35R8A0_GEOBA|nr:hypothetical protein GBAR_LOCUS4361 [Geodia barretti]